MITVSGSSDDLIEIDGDISEEFEYGVAEDDSGDLVAFSDGTVLRIWYGDAGVWRIMPIAYGTAFVGIEQAPENDETNYSDKATINAATWVVHGAKIARGR